MAEIGGKKLTTGEIVIAASGAVAFLFSFFTWFGEGDFTVNAWSGDFIDSFPLFTYIPIFGLIAALQIVLTKFANVNLPARILDFTWEQIHIVLGLFMVLLSFGIFVFGEEAKFGFFLCFLGSIGVLVGAVMLHTERGTAAAAPGTGTAPPTPF